MTTYDERNLVTAAWVAWSKMDGVPGLDPSFPSPALAATNTFIEDREADLSKIHSIPKKNKARKIYHMLIFDNQFPYMLSRSIRSKFLLDHSLGGMLLFQSSQQGSSLLVTTTCKHIYSCNSQDSPIDIGFKI